MIIAIITHLSARDTTIRSTSTYSKVPSAKIIHYLPETSSQKWQPVQGCSSVFLGEDGGSPSCWQFTERFSLVLQDLAKKALFTEQVLIVDYDTITLKPESVSQFPLEGLQLIFSEMMEVKTKKRLVFCPILTTGQCLRHLSARLAKSTIPRDTVQDLWLGRFLFKSKIQLNSFGPAAVTPASFEDHNLAAITSSTVFVGGVKSSSTFDKLTGARHESPIINLIRNGADQGAHFTLQPYFNELLNPIASVDSINNGLALSTVPNFPTQSATLFLQNYYTEDPSSIFDNHKQWGLYVDQFYPSTFLGTSYRNPKPRIGLFSYDFNGHVVGRHILPLVKELCKTFQVVLFDSQGCRDAINKEFRNLNIELVDISKLYEQRNYDGIVCLARLQNLDIAIDLSGHSAGNILPAFSRRLAPKQATFLGYCHSTGISQMDFRIVDAVTDPIEHQQFSTEKLIYLPNSFVCFNTTDTLPPVSRSPFLKNGHLSFGCFNNAMKLSQSCIKAFSAILHSVKNSTLSLSSSRLESQISKDVILSRFAMHGIFGDRIRFIDQTESNSDHLQKYNDIDIALDTFPYNGTTTTAEAILMGVPVSTFLGRRHSERVSSSILQNVEENRWIADSIDNYVDNTVEMSQDLESLVIGRTVLRDKYLEFNNPINYARDFKKVIEQILN